MARTLASRIGSLALLAVLLASVGVVVPVASSAAAAGPDAAAGRLDLRTVDFSTVPIDLDDLWIDEYEYGTDQVLGVAFGDLDGDAVAEAAVARELDYRDPYSERLERAWFVQVYRSEGRKVVTAGSSAALHQSEYERFDRLTISHQSLLYSRSLSFGDPAAGEGYIENMQYGLFDDGLFLRRTAWGHRHMAIDGPDRAGPLMDVWDRTAYVDVAAEAAGAHFRIKTADRKSVRMEADDPAAKLRVYDERTGRLVAELDGGSIAHLPGPGDWVAMPVASPDATRYFVTVADQRALYAPQLGFGFDNLTSGPRTERDDGIAHRIESISWHEIGWAHGAMSVDSVNEQIEGHVDAWREVHRAGAAACPDGSDAELYISSRPTLVSYDLVALEFSITSCLCENNDETVTRNLVVDLANGRVSETGSVLDLGQPGLAEVYWDWSPDWVTELLKPESIGGSVEIADATLMPSGVTLVISGASLDAGAIDDVEVPPIWDHHVFVGWEDLGDLVDPELRRRAESGRDVPLPSQGCGC